MMIWRTARIIAVTTTRIIRIENWNSERRKTPKRNRLLLTTKSKWFHFNCGIINSAEKPTECMKSIVYAVKERKKIFVIESINAGIKWRMERIQGSRNTNGGGILKHRREIRFKKGQVMENRWRISHRTRSWNESTRFDQSALQGSIIRRRGRW